MADETVVSRIAKRFTGRTPIEESERHGTESKAKTCRCEVCRRAFPDKAKVHKMRVRDRRTAACARGGAKGHPKCAGWSFAPGVVAATDKTRGARACQCPCHNDGRGRPIPTFEEWIAVRAADEARHRAFANGLVLVDGEEEHA